MKTPVIVLAIFLLGFLQHPKSLDCSAFKNGKFRSKLSGRDYVIERFGAIQKEYFVNTGDTTVEVLKVKWLDDCTYTLTPTEETRIKSMVPKGAVVTVSIISTTANSYTQTSKANFSKEIYTSEFFKMD